MLVRICYSCKKEIPPARTYGRGETCPYCSKDIRCCLNCRFYEQGFYNDCREPQAERITDKSKGNFCEYFSFRITGDRNSKDLRRTAEDKLEALFKK